jgi:hypothetical protein
MEKVYRVLMLDEDPRTKYNGNVYYEDKPTQEEAEREARRLVSQFTDTRVITVAKGSPHRQMTVAEFKLLPWRADCGHNVTTIEAPSNTSDVSYIRVMYVDPEDLFTTICPMCFDWFLVTGERQWRES